MELLVFAEERYINFPETHLAQPNGSTLLHSLVHVHKLLVAQQLLLRLSDGSETIIGDGSISPNTLATKM